MQYDVATPEEYLRALDQDWRRDTLVALREIIQQSAPELREAIRYKMLSYEDDRGPVFALNAQKGYVSLYVTDAEKVDPTGELLAGLDPGKVADTRIDAFITRAVAVRRQGPDVVG
jgi:hypothetical protein